MGNAASRQRTLPPTDYDFLIKNTEFSSAQILEWYDEFLQDCPNGQLTREKFLEIYTQLFAHDNDVTNALDFCEHVFRSFDTDSSGTIDFKEFMLAIDISSMGSPEQKLNWAFRMYDINGDGSIQPCEMIEIITAIFKMRRTDINNKNVVNDLIDPVKRTADIFARMDTDKDGKLSREEFIIGCLNDPQLFKITMMTNSAGPNKGRSDSNSRLNNL